VPHPFALFLAKGWEASILNQPVYREVKSNMEPFRTLTSLAAPLDRTNVDTDQIIPKQFLKRIERTGYGEFLFFDWRRTESGDPNPAFELNDPRYKGAKILIAGKNFGCGSSREHAAWALSDYGFRAVIAPTFADIFFSNAGKNGIVLVRLSEEHVAQLLHNAKTIPNYQLTVSLEAQTVTDTQGFHATFEVDPFRKFCLLEGLDDIGLTLRHEKALDTYEATHDESTWLKAK
jgi:3-isopropylmalate/(R)-2-methylmalate dehydratase small subunit